MDRRQHASKSNAHRGAAAATAGTSSGKRKGKGGGGGKKPIKVVYIGNSMRVTTSAAGFRALVQELTGRDADPSKYSGGGGAIIDVIDADDSSGGSGSLPAEPQPQPGALPSPGSTVESSDPAFAAAGHVPEPDCGYDDGEDSFYPQLIDNRYCVFSPPTFLHGAPHHEM